MGLKAELADPMTTPEDWIVLEEARAEVCSWLDVLKAAILVASVDWMEVREEASTCLLDENSALVASMDAEEDCMAVLEDSATAVEDLEAERRRCSEENTASFASA